MRELHDLLNRIAVQYEKYKKEHPKSRKTRNDPLFSSPTAADQKDALSFLQHHLAPDFADGDSPQHYRDAHKQIAQYFSDAYSKGKLEKWDTSTAHKKFKPIDNGRRVDPKHIEKPIIVGKLKNKYVVLDGNHRLITKSELNHPNVNAYVVPLD